MNTLHLLDTWTGGGVPRVVANLADYQTQQGHQVSVLCYRPTSQNEISLSQSRLPIHSLNLGARDLWRARSALQNHLSRINPDIIHDHYGGIWAASYLFSEQWRSRSVYHAHNEFQVIPESPDRPRFLRNRLFLNLLLPRYKRIIAISHHVKEVLQQKGRVTERNISVIHNAIKPDRFLAQRSAGQDINRELSLDRFDMTIGTVGRFVLEKGFDTVVDVAAELQKRGHKAAVLLVGSGDASYEATVRQQVESANLTDQVFFLGRREHVADYMRAMDIFLFASRQEPFGITLLEAMACGVPIVATGQTFGGGPEEIITHGKNGFLVKDRDVGQLADYCLKLVKNDRLRSDIIEAATKSLDNYANERIGAEVMACYREITNPGREPRN